VLCPQRANVCDYEAGPRTGPSKNPKEFKERISIPAIMHRRNLLGFEREIQQMKKIQNANLDPYEAFKKKSKRKNAFPYLR